jgi:hypothetical protein
MPSMHKSLDFNPGTRPKQQQQKTRTFGVLKNTIKKMKKAENR